MIFGTKQKLAFQNEKLSLTINFEQLQHSACEILFGIKIDSNLNWNKMNCELMLTYDTPALRQTGSRNLMGPKTLPMIWGTYMKVVTKYQISVINSC